jgi:hypothetical protein
MSRLKKMWKMPAWSRVAVSGVSSNGARAKGRSIATSAGMNAPKATAASCIRNTETMMEAATVARAMATVARAVCQLSGVRMRFM